MLENKRLENKIVKIIYDSSNNKDSAKNIHYSFSCYI